MTDSLFNALILGIDALVITLVARSKRTGMGLAGAATGFLAALVVATFLQEGTFHLFRLHAYLAFAHTPLVLLGIAWIVRARTKVVSRLCVSLAIVIWGVAGYAFMIEPHRLELTVVRLHSTKVSHSLRVAIVADLQTDRIGAYERRALTMALDAKPDLILMPGDYLHENSASRHQLAVDLNSLLKEIEFEAPMGAFATRGNTEHNDWPQLFAATRVTPFVDTTTITVDEVDVTGLDLWDSFDSELRVRGSERFHIVFGHSPDFSLGVSRDVTMNQPDVESFIAALKQRGHQLGWKWEHEAKAALGNTHEAVYDDRGRYLRVLDRPYNQVLVRST